METLKILGQLVPSASSLSALYTVPALTMASVSSVVVCNQNSGLWIAFRVSLAVSGAADDPNQYIYYDLPLDPNDTFIATIFHTCLCLWAASLLRTTNYFELRNNDNL